VEESKIFSVSLLVLSPNWI